LTQIAGSPDAGGTLAGLGGLQIEKVVWMADENERAVQSTGSPDIASPRAHELEKERERQYHNLLALSRLAAAVSGLGNLDAVLQVALDAVLDIMNGTIGGILLIDEQTRTLSYRVSRGLSAKYAQEVRMSLGEGIAGRVALTGRPILVEDISRDERTGHPDLVRTEGLKAFVSVPLRVGDIVLGVLNVASHLPHQFTRDDSHLLGAIGDQVGVAIEQARLQEHLRKGRERYQKLARQTVVAQEEERKRIAHELHDETSQGLTGVALQLQALIDMAEMSGGQNTELIARLKKVQSLTIHVHTEVSRLINDLRPALLDTLGLVAAIRRYAESTLRPLGINASVESKGVERPLPPEFEATLFRFAQGAIGNIVRHSGAHKATIVLEYLDSELMLQITDDGQGFDVSQVTAIEESGRGRGMVSMKERIRLLDGTCSVESQPGQGTTVWARVPTTGVGKDAEDKGTGSR